jgi:uncharacterized membrane protein (UPF0127 family)
MGTNERKRRRTIRQLVALGVLCLVAIVGFRALDSERKRGAVADITFTNPDGSITPVFLLEIAADGPSRSKGLMFRKPDSIPPLGGMIFVFPEDERLSFYMRNTYTSLDMVFLDSALKVQGILADVPILNDDPRTLGTVGRYVIELHAGTAQRYGITAGSVVTSARPLPRGR